MTVTTYAPPRFRSVPLFASTAGQDCIDLAEEAGLVLDEWQQDVIRDALGQDGSGRWAAMEVALIVPRQNGKGAILEALELYHLFAVPTTTLITHTAHRFDTCLDHFRRIRKLVEDTPDLLAMVKDNGRGVGDTPSGIKDSNGKESIELWNGSRLNFKAREKGSGRGFSGDLVVLDEAFWLKDLSGLIPTMAARENPQAWYTSSAPLPRIESDQLRSLIRQGRALSTDPDFERAPDDPTMAYTEWSVDQATDLEDEDTIRAGNPAYGIRINRRFCRMERQRMGDEVYARERLGIFPDADEAPKWLVVSQEEWERNATKEQGAARTSPGWLHDPVTLAVTVTIDHGWSSIVAVGECREQGVGGTVLAHGEGTDWVLEKLSGFAANTTKPVMIDPRSAASALIRPLTDAGIELREVTTAEAVRAAGELYDDLVATEQRFTHRDEPELNEAVATSTKRPVGGAWMFDGPRVCLTHGLALARFGHFEVEAPTPTLIF